MPNPKRRHSSARGKKRRTHYKLASASLSKCPQCGKPKISHAICKYCGYYKGRQIIEIKTAKEKQKEREKKNRKT